MKVAQYSYKFAFMILLAMASMTVFWGINDRDGIQVNLVGQLGARSLGASRVPIFWTVQSNGAVSSFALATLPLLSTITPRDINTDGIIVGYAWDPLAGDRLTVPLLWPSKSSDFPLVLSVPDLYEAGVADESVTAYGISVDGINNRNGLLTHQVAYNATGDSRQPRDVLVKMSAGTATSDFRGLGKW